MSSAAYGLDYLEAGISELESYLLSNELYWPLSASPPAGGAPYPRLTLGGLLLSQARAQAWPLTSQQRTDLTRLEIHMDTIRSRWRVAWGNKAAWEFRARLNLWRDFLEDFRRDPDGNLDRYAYEVGRRVILQLLLPEVEVVPPAEVEMLTGLDLLLQAVFLSGDFLWEGELARGFPPEKYWYLYGRLRAV